MQIQLFSSNITLIIFSAPLTGIPLLHCRTDPTTVAATAIMMDHREEGAWHIVCAVLPSIVIIVYQAVVSRHMFVCTFIWVVSVWLLASRVVVTLEVMSSRHTFIVLTNIYCITFDKPVFVTVLSCSVPELC